jgi:hypothetical protein
MPDPIRQLTVEQFVLLLEATRTPGALQREITGVHLHHTWRPRRQDFRGLATIEAMRRFHMETNGWSDIAQHLTIDPQGTAWTGRNWNRPPASQSGRNGLANAGPFMIEMVGDFDVGRDPFDGPQRQAAVDIVAALLHRFELDISALSFHRELGSPKTCPGTGVDKAAFSHDVEQALAAFETPRAFTRGTPRAPFSVDHLAGHAVTRAFTTAGEDPPEAEVSEDPGAAREIDRLAQASVAGSQVRRFQHSPTFVPVTAARESAAWSGLKPYVVNLSKGQLSEHGQFEMHPDSLDMIAESLRRFVMGRPAPQVILFAHGGLVSEGDALAYARDMLPWWLGKDVYPISFIWETGIWDVLRQRLFGARVASDLTDRLLEETAGPPGRVVWSDIKESARLASSTDAGDGVPGGGLLFADRFGALFHELSAANHAPGVHAVGHSAGAILHAHLLPALIARGVRIDTVSFLAPAIRVDLFEQMLLSHVSAGGGAIGRLSVFTMSEEAELQDNCWNIYRKSLLYFISRGFESKRQTPILGLEESLQAHSALRRLFGLDGSAPAAELQLSMPKGYPPNPLTHSLRHTGFDNDPKTMSAVLRRITGVDDGTGYGEADFPESVSSRAIDLDVPREPYPDGEPAEPVMVTRSTAGRRRALCIGVDAYRERPLTGCVADARAWERALQQAGFSVGRLHDGRATRSAIVDALGTLVSGAAAGDVIVFQYSGHGTQLDDVNGDERDRLDEAFVPVDYHEGRFLLDDDLAEILTALPKGVVATLFMDCCHSGTLSRFAPSLRARLASDERVRFLPAGPDLQAAHAGFRAQFGPAHRRGIVASLPGVVHFAACQDNEYAYESKGSGDFTRAGVALLSAALARGDTNETFLAAVRKELARLGRQHPQLMRLPAALRQRPLLAPTDGMNAASTSEPAPADGREGRSAFESELLGRVQAIETLLRDWCAGQR